MQKEATLPTAGMEPLPDDSQCPTCGYFDTAHPDVIRILMARDPKGRQLRGARCKCLDIQRAKDDMRWVQANLPHGPSGPRTLDNFADAPGTQEMHEAATAFAHAEGPRILMLQGPKGVGKSHTLESLVRASLENGHRARYELAGDFLNRLRHTYDHDTQEDLYSLSLWYSSLQLLALDEVGLQSASDWVREQVYNIVNDRVKNGRRLVVASMRNKQEMESLMGDAVASRLYGTNTKLNEVRLVTVVAGDYR